MQSANWGHKLHQVLRSWSSTILQYYTSLPFALTPVYAQRAQTHVIKQSSYFLLLFLLLSDFGKKTGRKVVKAEGANLVPKGAHSPSLSHKDNKMLALPNIWQLYEVHVSGELLLSFVKGCVRKFVLYGDPCISIASYLNRYQFKGQDQGSLWSWASVRFFLGWGVCLVCLGLEEIHSKKHTQSGNQLRNVQKMLTKKVSNTASEKEGLIRTGLQKTVILQEEWKRWESRTFHTYSNRQGLEMAKSRRKFVQPHVFWTGGIGPSACTSWQSVTAIQAGLPPNPELTCRRFWLCLHGHC